MTPTEISATLKHQFGDKIKAEKLDGTDPHVVIEPANLVAVLRYMRDDPRLKFAFLNCITGTDYFEPDPKKVAKAGFEPHLEVVYHLSNFASRERFHRFAVKLILPRWKNDKPGELPELPSVTSLWKGADWHEREVYDLCGVWFTGHPDLTRILLSDDWIGHPLRKDYEFPLEYHGIRGR